jgi:flagellar biosynthesis/type III secretory pathway M-ring protein FliF/YscJ
MGHGAGKGSAMNRKTVIILVIVVAVILLVLLIIYAANLTSGYQPF